MASICRNRFPARCLCSVHHLQVLQAVPVAAVAAAGDVMKFAIILALISIGGMIFGWWGHEPPTGQSHYKEMAGIIPLFAGIALIIALPIAGMIYYFARR